MKTTPKVPRCRNGFYYFGENIYPRISKIISDTLAKKALFYWGIKQAAKIALADPSLDEDEVRSAVLQIGKRSAQRGLDVHSIAETWCRDRLLPLAAGEYQGYIQALHSWLNAHNPKPLKSEIELYSDVLNIAGRCDLVCSIHDENWIIDFKTGKTIYSEVSLQLQSYRIMWTELKLQPAIDKTGVVLLKDDGTFLFQETKAATEDVIHLRGLWEWTQKKGE